MNLEMNRPRERSLVETKLDQAQSKKSVTHTENYQKAMNLLNGLGPNKENEITTFNLSRRQLLKPGRDLKELDIKSVDRRSLSLLDGLRSNKAQESEGKNCQYFSNSSSSNDETSSSQSQNVSKELLGASVSN